jgi:hypothetical protein
VDFVRMPPESKPFLSKYVVRHCSLNFEQGRFYAFFSHFWLDLCQICVFSAFLAQFSVFSGKWSRRHKILAESGVPNMSTFI